MKKRYKTFTNHYSLKYFCTQNELNMRHHIWLKLGKDYNYESFYHLGKVNGVADVLHRKVAHSTSLMSLRHPQRHLFTLWMRA